MKSYERDIREHIFMIGESFVIENGHLVGIKPKYNFEYREDWLNYANATLENRQVFSATDYDETVMLYQNAVEKASDLISSCAHDDLEKVICTMEYMRLMVTYEFVCEVGEENRDELPNHAHTFSGSGLNAAIMGRGICQSQAAFCRDVLNNLGIDARKLGLTTIDHADVLVEEQGVLDPTNYVGTIDSLAGGHLFKKARLENYSDFSWIDQTVFNNATNRMQQALIRYLEVDTISEQLGLSTLNITEKQFVIWCFLAKHIALYDKPENSYTIGLRNHEIEITNLLELFYKANYIPINRSKHTNGRFRHETYDIFETTLEGNTMMIVPRISIKEGEDMHGQITPIAYYPNFKSYKIYKDEVLKAKAYYRAKEKYLTPFKDVKKPNLSLGKKIT